MVTPVFDDTLDADLVGAVGVLPLRPPPPPPVATSSARGKGGR